MARRNRDEGFAMVSVIAIGGIATALTMATLVATTTAMRRSLLDRQREQAIQLAEAGVNSGVEGLNQNGALFTSINPPTPMTKAWVVNAAASLPVAQGREGEFAFVIPMGLDRVYGVGYVPSRANPVVTRVIELRIERIVSISNAGLVSGGQATMGGSSLISTGGGVHANGNLTLSGNATVTGAASSAGVATATGSATVVGPMNSGTALVSLSLDPLSYRSKTQYDLCPDGTIRNTSATPCAGTIYAIGSGLGWDWKGGQWERKGAGGDGFGFFGHQVNVELKSTWTGFLVTNPLIVSGVRLNGDVTSNGNGGVNFSGNDQLALVVGRDFTSRGNTDIVGDVMVAEQVSLSGSTKIQGQVIAVSDGDSAGSPVNITDMTGNSEIQYRSTTVSDPSGAAPTSWSELR
ncbi:MAG: hypothetical protein ACLGH3_02945 [Actinomycetota bacterium]